MILKLRNLPEINSKIKVLFISSWFPNRVKPTLGNFVHKHAEAVSQYADVSVLHVCFDETLKGKQEIVYSSEKNINSIFIYLKKINSPIRQFINYLKAYRNGLKLISEKYGKPDIIHANIIFPVGLVFLFNKAFKKFPFVVTEHWTGFLPDDPEKISFIKKYLIKRITRKSKKVLLVTENLKNAMLNLGFKGDYKVVPNVVDTSLFVITDQNKKSIKNILHISSFVDEQKNISGILRAIKKLSEKRNDFAMHFITDGDAQPFIDYAKNNSLLDKYVFFHGTKSTGQVAEMLEQSDFLLLFSNYENFPCVIVEAFSCGVPVVSTNVGGISEHVSDKHGILIKPKDENALLTAIGQMLDNTDKYDKQFLHDYAENNFSYKSVGKQINDIYSEILNKK